MNLFQSGGRAIRRVFAGWGTDSFLSKEEKAVIAAGLVLLVVMFGLGFSGSIFNARNTATPTADSKITQDSVELNQAPSNQSAVPAGFSAQNPGDGSIKGDIMQVDGGNYHTCLRTRAGTVYCWGQGAYGQLGTGTHFKAVPTKTLVITGAAEISAGGRFTCALVKSGEVFCWGETDKKQTGTPQTEKCGDVSIDSVCAPTPKKVEGLAEILSVSAGESHACALNKDGSVLCWGSNENGQIGGSDSGDRMAPATVEGLADVKQITAGGKHTCALIGSPGSVKCWGDNEKGQAGGSADRITVPVTVPGLTDIVEVSAGGAHTCARHQGGNVSCWGYNYLGQLGNGSTRPTTTAMPIDVIKINNAVQIVSGRYHTCARGADKSIHCWGLNRKGEIGDGTTKNRSTPTAVTSVNDAQFVASGKWHYCYIKLAGGVSCWGDNLGGQLGIGDHNSGANPKPLPVKSLPSN